MPIKPMHTRAALAVLALAGCASVHADEWKNSITPYIWASGMSGNVAIGTPLGTLESDVDMSFSDIVKNLDFGAMVSYEGGRDKWVVLGDFIFMNLGGAKTTNPLNATVRAGADMRQTMFEGDVGYHITDAISLIAGARYNDINGSISVDTTTILGTKSRTAKTSESWVDPVVGLLGEWPLAEHWEWDLRADIGGEDVRRSYSICSAVQDGMLRIAVKKTPGGVFSGQNETFVQKYAARTMMGRMGQPHEIADAVTFLVSDRASYITGQILAVDGGRSVYL